MADIPNFSTKDEPALYDRGKRCILWGAHATEMSKEQLLIFVGFLDELVEAERAGTAPKPAKDI